jgi:hypothetical protein
MILLCQPLDKDTADAAARVALGKAKAVNLKPQPIAK